MPAALTSDVVYVLHCMGHGDELAICDANFPAYANGCKVIDTGYSSVPELLGYVLRIFPLDDYSPVNSAVMMKEERDRQLPTPARDRIISLLQEYCDGESRIEELPREAFYERSRKAYAIIRTGDTSLYANVIIKRESLLRYRQRK
ncbi:RbsD/FucU family protein [Alicyclobacillus acidocaldarius]|uniref:RbsD/FucU family protein n=1 Tax=Alicyclobacillus acidocaldarius TaxID=405212 RepID=UPI0035BEA078